MFFLIPYSTFLIILISGAPPPEINCRIWPYPDRRVAWVPSKAQQQQQQQQQTTTADLQVVSGGT